LLLQTLFSSSNVLRSLTWLEVGLHEGQDGVAGRQVQDPDAQEVFVCVRLPEQLVELKEGERQREREREREREEMINEAGNELIAASRSP